MRFVAVGLVTALLLSLVTGWLSRLVARQEAVKEARTTTELLARTVVQPALTHGLVTAEAADIDRFDRLVRRAVGDTDVLRVKVWNADGMVVYSDEPRLIGQQFALGDDQQRVLTGGGSAAEVSNLGRSENTFERPLGRVLEVYTRVETPDGQPLLFEVYYAYTDVVVRADRLVAAFRPISVGAVLVFLLLAVPIVWLLARRVDAAARDRERLLVAAARASDAERRRVARDLHDGVVQELAGTSFALSAAARGVAAGEVDRTSLRSELERLAASLRSNLRSLRSLLVEIYPPDLEGPGLAAAVDDLLAPAAAAGVSVTTELADAAGWPDDVVALIWRATQECVRNALRHAQPSAITVRLTTSPADGSLAASTACLEVSDDGVGFDAAQPVRGDHFGLRGLRDLAAEMGGSVQVTSSLGQGTTVRVEVPLR